MHVHSPPRTLIAGALSLLAAACAPAYTAAPADIPKLEATLQRTPDAIDPLVQLGIAYRAAHRPDDAVRPLERALQRDPRNATAMLFLGLAQEDRKEYEEAARWYAAYLKANPGSAMERQVHQRLALVSHERTTESVKQALADEARLRSTPPEPHTLAVLPFRVSAQDTSLQPLGRAMAELLTTDLSQTARVKVLERARVQMLIDEMQLAVQQRVDPATAARAGRLLGAERLLEGDISGDDAQLRLQAILAQVPALGGSGGTVAPQSFDTKDRLAQLFDMEKRTALGIYESLGIELTAAERQQVTRRATQNIQALLAYGLGLEDEDAGQFEAAAQRFKQAHALDPHFTVAAERAAEASAAAAAKKTTTDAVAQQAMAEAANLAGGLVGLVPGLNRRDPAEALGGEGVAGQTLVDILIRRPR